MTSKQSYIKEFKSTFKGLLHQGTQNYFARANQQHTHCFLLE